MHYEPLGLTALSNLKPTPNQTFCQMYKQCAPRMSTLWHKPSPDSLINLKAQLCVTVPVIPALGRLRLAWATIVRPVSETVHESTEITPRTTVKLRSHCERKSRKASSI
jgi:hypothetical protein